MSGFRGRLARRCCWGLLLLLPALPARAQDAQIDCIGAERLEDDAFAIPFGRNGASLGPAAEPALAAVLARLRETPGRGVCVLGHSGTQEGGAVTSRQLAARRATVVAAALAERGVPRDTLRAEVRATAFTRSSAVPAERSVLVVLLPAPG